LLLGVFVFGLPIRGSLALLMLESMLFITVSLSLGIFISTVSPNQMVALFFSVFALLLSTLLLSSFIFPIENMPQWAQAVNVINPFAYFMKVIRMIMLQGSGIADIRHEIYSLLLYAAVIIPLAAWRYKKVA
jgi:ABC-2 type transport system permease protein